MQLFFDTEIVRILYVLTENFLYGLKKVGSWVYSSHSIASYLIVKGVFFVWLVWVFFNSKRLEY